MKHLMLACAAATALCALADGETKDQPKTEAAPAAEVEHVDAPLFWGFANYGIYSGYQLYGSLVNREPTLQGYLEGNFNIPADLGYVGVGLWSNTDLTGKRSDSLYRAFNEWDFNVHYGKTFWFDDARTWGLDYRIANVWYWYPRRAGRPSTPTTVDLDNYFTLVNPYIQPFINVIHEYHESKGCILEFGVKRPTQITDAFSVNPSFTMVWRDSNYGWCFPGYGTYPLYGENAHSGFATLKLQLDATYMFTSWFGVFGKVAWCHVIDQDLRDTCDQINDLGCTEVYGNMKDFAWGGVGVCFNF